MTDYEKQALDFLAGANAKIDMRFVGRAVSRFEREKRVLRNLYDVSITTPLGSMNIEFWDSIRNTKITQMSVEEYAKQRFKAAYDCLTVGDRIKAHKELKSMQAEAKPTAYDVLASLPTYDSGGFEDFCAEFGYSNDSIRAFETYLACDKEYKDLRRIFGEAQLDKLREII